MFLKIKESKVLFICIAIVVLSSDCTPAQDNIRVREAMVAGSFYPADSEELKTTIDFFIENAGSADIVGNIRTVIVPHAGYIYSGHVAARAYACLKNSKFDRVVVLSPSHIESFKGASVYDGDAYETPLGRIPVDKDFAIRLVGKNSLIQFSSKGHESTYMGRGEHALEVQLPFLQRVLGEFRLVPVILGDQNYETCRALGFALAELINDDKTLIVASSDLSHFHNYEKAEQLDNKVIRSIKEWDYFNLYRNLQSGICEACGGGPIITAMIASESIGANEARLLKYASSGDVPAGDKSRVVGYAAFALIESPDAGGNQEKSFRLNKTEQNQLLQIARTAVEYRVKEGDVLSLDKVYEAALFQDRGAFVTLKIGDQLRGCIGYTSPVKPLCETVRDAAIQAATRDPRFKPVNEGELTLLHYSISVLSPFRRILDVNQIRVGYHGLLIKKGNYTGLLLPQVPVEQSWDRQTFIEQTCCKAGLSRDAWKDADTDIFGFTAFVFGDP